MEIEDPYRELGLTAEASDAEVKAAWRRLSARWHPDRNSSPQALQRIQQINRAVEEIRRARAQPQEGGRAPAPAPTPAAASAAAAPADDAGTEEAAIEHAIGLSLEEAAAGCIRTVQGEIVRSCTACSGSGQAPEPVPCSQCDGHGQVRQTLWFPWLTTPAACAACDGDGATQVPCACCAGSGQAAPLAYRSRLRIPAGVRDGHVLQARVKLQGGGGQLPVQVLIHLEPHEFMALQPDGTIQVQLPVDGLAWVAQRWIDVPTPYGLRQMRLQRGALTYRMREQGFPASPSGPRADCLVTVLPLFPAEWDARQDALLDALVQSNTGNEATDAGTRTAEWQRTLAAWQRRRGSAQET